MIPQLESERLLLRGVELSDAPSYQKHFNDYEVISQLHSNVPWPYPSNGAEAFIRDFILPRQGNNRWCWGIFLRENTSEMIGGIELWRQGNPENRGFWLGRRFWNQGIMTEAVNLVMDCAFDQLGFDKLVFSNALGNVKSRRLKEKMGARLVGVRPETFVNPTYKKAETWELNKFEWITFKQLRALEEALWKSETRYDLSFQEKIFAMDFIEFGRSGRIYSRSEAIRTEGQEIRAKLPLPNLTFRMLDQNTAQLTYVSEVQYEELEIANRSSIWIKTAEGWKLRFHQGTPVTLRKGLNG